MTISSLTHFENVAAPSQSQEVIRVYPYSPFISGRVHILSKIAITKKQPIEKPKNLNLLNTVPFESGFHFYTELGKYNGITACSMVEFAEKLQTVPVQSVMFHFQRQDFQKWFKNTIGDEELEKELTRLKPVLKKRT